jgi:hypothetical protein
MTDKERYATIGTWERIFREEGVKISIQTLRRRIAAAKINGKTGRNHMKVILKNGFYPESDIRQACSDLLQDFPLADSNGLVEIDGETYGHMHGLSKQLDIAGHTIQYRIMRSSLQFIQGKDSGGRLVKLYRLSDVRTLCIDLLQDFPRANKDGLIEIDEDVYGTIKGFATKFGVSRAFIKSRLEKGAVKIIQGRNASGRLVDYYLLSEVQMLCRDFLEDLPQTDKSGFIKIGGKVYGTRNSFSKRFGISATTIQSEIEESALKSIRGKDNWGHLCDLFPETEVCELCARFLRVQPRSDKEGFIYSDGESYGSVNALSKKLGLSHSTVRYAVQNNSLLPVRGKNRSGRITNFYSLSKVHELCADLIAKKSKK